MDSLSSSSSPGARERKTGRVARVLGTRLDFSLLGPVVRRPISA